MANTRESEKDSGGEILDGSACFTFQYKSPHYNEGLKTKLKCAYCCCATSCLEQTADIWHIMVEIGAESVDQRCVIVFVSMGTPKFDPGAISVACC